MGIETAKCREPDHEVEAGRPMGQNAEAACANQPAPRPSARRYARMRLALVPTSLSPTRDTERTSTRLPAPFASTRITTSSLKPNQNVVSVASMRPAAASESGSGRAGRVGPHQPPDSSSRERGNRAVSEPLKTAFLCLKLARRRASPHHSRKRRKMLRPP